MRGEADARSYNFNKFFSKSFEFWSVLLKISTGIIMNYISGPFLLIWMAPICLNVEGFIIVSVIKNLLFIFLELVKNFFFYY